MNKAMFWLHTFFIGAGITPMAMAIAKWRKASVPEESILISVAVICFVIAIVVEKKYKLYPVKAANKDGRKSLYERYPALVRYTAMVVGIFAGVVCCSLLVGSK